MWSTIDRCLEPIFHYCSSLNRQESIYVSVGTLLIGYFCMRDSVTNQLLTTASLPMSCQHSRLSTQ